MNKLLGEVGFAGMVRYAALFIGILLAIACFLCTARLPKKKWNSKLNWVDFTLFKDPAFATYTIGAYLVMFVAAIARSFTDIDLFPGGDFGLLSITSRPWPKVKE